MKSFPFESQITGYTPEGYPILDRAVDSTILSQLDKLFFNNGVFANPSTNFQVVQASGMTVDVYAGACIIEGARGYEDTTRNLAVEASNTVYDRIDTVVLRLNRNVEVRSIDLYVKKGTASTTPSAPALTRDSSIYELGIANLFIAKNTTTITQARITDTRLDTSRCGIATPFETVDTDGIFNQYQDALDQYLELVRNSLDDTQAGYLQGLINDANARIDTLEQENTNYLHFQHSTTEKWTGKYWVDGKKIYSKVVTNITLPNATMQEFQTSILSIDKMIAINGFATNGTNYFPLPHTSTTSTATISIFYRKNNNTLDITTGLDRSSYTATLVLEYTKTTD